MKFLTETAERLENGYELPLDEAYRILRIKSAPQYLRCAAEARLADADADAEADADTEEC